MGFALKEGWGVYSRCIYQETPPAMSISLLRLDVAEIFCDVDDFYEAFEATGNLALQLDYET